MKTNETIIPAEKVKDLPIDSNAHENPYLDPASAKSLIQSITENGQIDPVIMYDGIVMDGRNRIKAIIDLKMDLKVLELTDCSYDEAVEYARAKNDDRRHMDTSQLAMRAAYEIIKSRFNDDGSKKPRPQWLKVEKHRDVQSSKISKTTVESAIRIASNYPEYAEQIFKGERTLQKVLKIIDMQKKKQAAAEDDLVAFQAQLDQDPFYYPNGDLKPKTLVYEDKTASHLGAEYSEAAAERYLTYTKTQTVEELAKRLVELEEQIQENNQK